MANWNPTRHLPLGRKAMKNLDSILKSRDITLPTKVLYSQSYGFSSSVYSCESWTIMKPGHWRIETFEVWYCKDLKVPWTAQRLNQSILKEFNSEYSLEGLLLKLKLQYFGHLMQTVDSLEKTLMLWKIKGRRRRGRQSEMFGWHHRFNGHELGQNPGDGEEQGSLARCTPWGHSWTWLSNWTTIT